MTDVKSAPGLLIVIVGPSGVGKDTLINALRADEKIANVVRFIRRTITRPASKDAEDFLSVDAETFARNEQNGLYCVTWSAHSLSYGVPKDVLDFVEEGGIAILNGARRALPALNATFSTIKVIRITASFEAIAKRLKQRGRESAAALEERLEQKDIAVDASFNAIKIDNSGPLEEGSAALKASVIGLIQETYDLEVVT